MDAIPVRVYLRDGAAAEIGGRTPRTAAYLLYYHYVFRVKYNAPAITAAMAERLVDILERVCAERGYVLFAAAVMPDHVHLVLSLKPATAPAEAMRYIKGRLAHDLHKDMGGGGSLWADGYYVEAVGTKNVFQVLHYVVRQEEHHGDGPA